MRPHRYILDEAGEPVPCDDIIEWARGFDMEHRRVAETVIDNVRVSTVFLGIDHAFDGGPPVLWETMIFGGEHDEYCDRYTSRADAVAGHTRAVDMVLAGVRDGD